MVNVIEKSGTGIERSGTGIEKSGTGIEKSGTGLVRATVVLAALAAMLLSVTALAADTRLAISDKNGHAIVSVHGEDGVMVGASTAPIDGSGYARIPLYSVLQSANDVFSMGLMVQGSGSGSAGESAGSRGSSLLVQGSGSGDAGESFENGGQVLVQGSGSGSSGESCSDGPGLLVQGSGSGSSGESSGCSGSVNIWGYAEVVFDQAGAHVVVNQVQGSRQEEFLVAFLPGSNGEFAYSSDRGQSNRGFVATP
ncbi:hypothetical protein [Wenzhouxiangella sp. EGI_FJ10305]|uniref:hypothetical protein n=1 Tax=Wenzhouxiangella sp. EGI_FJ10305 TaxID=3243768 RepID=UPI0035D942E4